MNQIQLSFEHQLLMEFVMENLDTSGQFFKGYVDPIIRQVHSYGTPNYVVVVNGKRVPVIARYTGLIKVLSNTSVHEWLDNVELLEVVPEEYFYLLNINLELQKLHSEITNSESEGKPYCPYCKQYFGTIRTFHKHFAKSAFCRENKVTTPGSTNGIVSASRFYEVTKKAEMDYQRQNFLQINKRKGSRKRGLAL